MLVYADVQRVRVSYLPLFALGMKCRSHSFPIGRVDLNTQFYEIVIENSGSQTAQVSVYLSAIPLRLPGLNLFTFSVAFWLKLEGFPWAPEVTLSYPVMNEGHT